MTAESNDLTGDFLKTHRLGVLATGRKDGSPQQALIAYMFDGNEFAIRTSDASAKAKNIRKRAKVSLSVIDGPKFVVVYGSARLVEGPAAAPYLERMAQQMRPAGSGGSAAASAATRTQAGNTLVILVSPEKYMSARLEG